MSIMICNNCKSIFGPTSPVCITCGSSDVSTATVSERGGNVTVASGEPLTEAQASPTGADSIRIEEAIKKFEKTYFSSTHFDQLEEHHAQARAELTATVQELIVEVRIDELKRGMYEIDIRGYEETEAYEIERIKELKGGTST